MIHIRSNLQNAALQSVLDEMEGASRIDISETARQSLYVVDLNRTGKARRIVYIQVDGDLTEVEAPL